MEDAAALHLSEAQYQEYITNIRDVCRNQGIDYILDKYDADIILGPADSTLSTLASGSGEHNLSFITCHHSTFCTDFLSGYPIVGMPLGYLDLNGRAIGMVALARKHHEATLIRFIGAWDETFHPRKPPPMLVDNSTELDAH